MSDRTLKADQERQGWTQPSDIAWTMGYVIVTVCRQSISDSWLGNLRECLAHLV